MTGWTPAQIRAAVEARGTTIRQLSIDHGLAPRTLDDSLCQKRRRPKFHAIVAGFLSVSLHDLWPDIYAPGEVYRPSPKAKRYPPAVFEKILWRVQRGESRVDISKEPGQPSAESVSAYMRRNPGFARRMKDAYRAQGKSLVTADEVERVLSEVERGEKVIAACQKVGRAYSAILRFRRLNAPPEGEARWGEAIGRRVTPERKERLVEAIKAGGTLRGSAGIISRGTIYRLRQVDPDFATALRRARESGREVAARAAAARKLSPDEVWRVVENAVRHVRPEARDDIRGDLMMALLEGRVSADQAGSAVRGLVTAWNREFARRDMSFDQELGDGEGLTFGGLIAAPGSYAPDGVQVIRAGWS